MAARQGFSCSRTIALATAALLLAVAPARAQIGSDRYSSIVVDASDGRVLSAANPDEPRHPASLTKMMTLYMVFEAMRDRRISLNRYVPVSPHAASMVPTKLDLVPGTKITVEEAILGMVTLSANDAAAALGEMLGGDEERFAEMMTLRARALGMSHTEFHNASGLPDPNQWTTARDMALLGRRLLQDFPNEYRYFSTPSFRFHGRLIVTHDHMLQTYPGADGIKTGYVEASGFNMVTSALRGEVRLIGVVMGASHAGERDVHMAALLDQGFEQMNVPVGRHEPQVAARLPSIVPAAHAATLPPPRPPAKWSVQVGAFATEVAARQAAESAHTIAQSGEIHVEPLTQRGHITWRAQLIGLNPAEARGTCAALARHHMACTPLRPDPGQLARN